MSEQKENDFVSQAYLIWLLSRSNDTQLFGKSENPTILREHLDTVSFPEQGSAAFNYKFVKKLKGLYHPESVMNGIVSKATGDRSKDKKQSISFFDLETHKLTSLVPELRLYKLIGSKLIPFYFPIVSDYSPLENNSTEGTSAGYVGGNTIIQNFSVVYEGQDFFTSKRYLVCSLRLKVDSLANIFLEKKGYARLADLFALRTDKASVTKNTGGKSILPSQMSNPSEILAVLGYSFRDSQEIFFTEDETRQITENVIPIRMNPGDHTINLNQDGTATIDIEYTAWLDSFDLDRNSYSTFANSAEIIRETELKVNITDGGQNITDTREKVEDIKDKAKKRDFIKKKLIDKQSEIRAAVELIEKANRFFYLDVESSALANYIDVPYLNSEEPPPAKPMASPRPPVPGGTSDQAKILEEIKRISGTRRSIHFFVLGDLIEAFCRKTEHTLMIAKQEVIKKSKLPADKNPYTKRKAEIMLKEIEDKIKKINSLVILLSDIILRFADDKEVRINLADIPISSEIFQEFVFREIIDINTSSYTIKDFLKGCYGVLLSKALSDFKDHAPFVLDSNDLAFSAVTYTAPQMRKVSGTDVEPKNVPGPNVFAGAEQVENGKEYYVIMPQPNQKIPTNKIGNQQADLKKGIYHFHLGKNRGIIKDISFSKFNVPSRREALLVNQINIYDELKMPYNANVTMFGNNLFMPGSQIYIDPFSIGFGDPRDKNSAAAQLGLGGYYTVLKVSTTYSSQGTLTTKLDCGFSSFPEAQTKSSNLVNGLSLGNREDKANSVDAALNEKGDTAANPDPPYARTGTSDPDSIFAALQDLDLAGAPIPSLDELGADSPDQRILEGYEQYRQNRRTQRVVDNEPDPGPGGLYPNE